MGPAAAIPFDPGRVGQLCGVSVTWLTECASTQQVAAGLARGGAPDPIVVGADHQTAGRGRQGRTWWSPPGLGLLFSVVLRPAVAPDRVARGVLVWGAVLAEVLDVALKWPNDLVDEQDRKLGGLKAELSVHGGRVEHVVLGIGINVNHTAFEGLPGATSLRLRRGRPVDREALLAAILPPLLSADIAAPAALDRWRARARTLGRRVRVGAVEGLATGIRDDGALLVGGTPVLAGDVELVT